ncbi:MAG: helix-turn-helix domain-containing protein [bacterium]|nr:helix-turn-helix domain-containing protein [bacterium]
MRLESLLKQIDFSDNGAKIYLFLVKRLEATAFEVAKETGIPRTTVYKVLSELEKGGLISSFKKNKVAYFSPESTQALLYKNKEREEIIKQVLPELEALIVGHDKAPKIGLYTGKEGIKFVLEDVLETLKADKIKQLYATSLPSTLEFLPRFFPDWLKRREEIGVYTQLIVPNSVANHLGSNNLREVRVLPDKFTLDTAMDIYGRKVAFFLISDQEAYAIIIESEQIADTFKQFFLFTWQMLGQQNGITD